MALQGARQLGWAGRGVADDGQQHLDEQRGVQIHAAGPAGQAVLALALGDLVVGGEVDEDAVQGVALDELGAQGGEQEGPHGNVQQGAQLLVRPAGLGLRSEAGHGACECAVAGEARSADRERAEAVEALWVDVSVEAAVAVVAATVADFAEVAESGVREAPCRAVFSSGLLGKAFSGLDGRRGAGSSGLLASGWWRARVSWNTAAARRKRKRSGGA